MTKRGILVSLLLLAVLAACSKTLSPAEGQKLVREYLAPFKVENLVFKSMTKMQVPGAGDAYVVVADFVVPYKPGIVLNPMPGQTFYITHNEMTRRHEINPQLTHVAECVQGMIDLRRTADTMKATPYNPAPWNKP